MEGALQGIKREFAADKEEQEEVRDECAEWSPSLPPSQSVISVKKTLLMMLEE